MSHRAPGDQLYTALHNAKAPWLPTESQLLGDDDGIQKPSEPGQVFEVVLRLARWSKTRGSRAVPPGV